MTSDTAEPLEVAFSHVRWANLRPEDAGYWQTLGYSPSCPGDFRVDGLTFRCDVCGLTLARRGQQTVQADRQAVPEKAPF
jgi:hypothetical protein